MALVSRARASSFGPAQACLLRRAACLFIIARNRSAERQSRRGAGQASRIPGSFESTGMPLPGLQPISAPAPDEFASDRPARAVHQSNTSLVSGVIVEKPRRMGGRALPGGSGLQCSCRSGPGGHRWEQTVSCVRVRVSALLCFERVASTPGCGKVHQHFCASRGKLSVYVHLDACEVSGRQPCRLVRIRVRRYSLPRRRLGARPPPLAATDSSLPLG